MNEGKVFALGIFGSIVIIIGVGLGVSWISRGNDLAQEKVFAAKEEQIRRETFEESKPFNESMAQDMYSAWAEYVKATPEQKLSLRSIILHRTAGYNLDKFPNDLRQFISSLRSEVTK